MERLENVAILDFQLPGDGRFVRRTFNTATQTTFTISGAHDSCNVPNGLFNVQFLLRHGSPTLGRQPQ